MKNFALAFALLSAAVLSPSLTHAVSPSAAQNSQIITAPAPEENLLADKIYFFAHSMCHSCKDAFVYFARDHKDLHIEITDMKFHHNLELYKQCVKKFNIPNSNLRLPLICMGDNYIMGWEPASETLFEEYLQQFQQENASRGE